MTYNVCRFRQAAPALTVFFFAIAFLAALAGCAAPPPEEPPPQSPPPRTGSSIVEVREVVETPPTPEDGIDSVALWLDGESPWLLATAKSTHRLNVYNALSGKLLRTVGEEGDALGELRYPNGLAVVGDLAFVVERDNRRVQIFRLPELSPVGTFGEEELRRPYGLAILETERDGRGEAGFDVWITDNYETPAGEVPPAAELGERVKRFRVQVAEDGAVTAKLLLRFGDRFGKGVLHVVESIAADPLTGLLLVADEDPRGRSAKGYTFEGELTGTFLGQGLFMAEPEGIALYACDPNGFWILTDQMKTRSVFRVFDRRGLMYYGSFVGKTTANTDGVAITATPLPGMPDGAFYAVHDDQSISVFDWRQVTKALELPEC